MKRRFFAALIVTMVGTTGLNAASGASAGQALEFKLERQRGKNLKRLKKADFLAHLKCYPNLISRRPEEAGYAKDLTVTYGPYQFRRTDIGDPDGEVFVTYNDKALCKIAISISRDHYFSLHDELLILDASNASSAALEVFDLKNGCKYLGYLDYTTDKGADSDIVKVLDEQSDAQRWCKKE